MSDTTNLPMLRRPIWADAAHMGSIGDTLRTVVSLPVATLTRVAGNNPNRWAIGFMLDTLPSLAVNVSPYLDCADRGFTLDSAPRFLWLTLFEFGELVSRDWYAHTLAVQSLTVFELVTRV